MQGRGVAVTQQPVLDGLPVTALFTWPCASRSVERSGHGARTALRRRVRELELRRDRPRPRPSAHTGRSPRSAPGAGPGRGGSRRCRPRSGRPRRPLTDQRRPAAIAATPLHHVTISSSRSRSSGASTSTWIARHDPEVLGHAPARLLHVVDRRVLEEAGDRVEPHPARDVHVREPDAAARGERARAPAGRGIAVSSIAASLTAVRPRRGTAARAAGRTAAHGRTPRRRCNA